MKLDETLRGIVENWIGLQAGIFSDFAIKSNPNIKSNISNFCNLKINDEFIYAYLSNRDIINGLSVFGYWCLFSGIKGIISGTFEGMKKPGYHEYLRDKLNNQYDDFENIIEFLRHLFNHSDNLDIKIEKNKISKFLNGIKSSNKKECIFIIDYNKFGLIHNKIFIDNNDGIIQIDFNNSIGKNLLDVIKINQLIMIAMLCADLAQTKYNEKKEDVLKNIRDK